MLQKVVADLVHKQQDANCIIYFQRDEGGPRHFGIFVWNSEYADEAFTELEKWRDEGIIHEAAWESISNEFWRRTYEC
jgi:hypothetical protein